MRAPAAEKTVPTSASLSALAAEHLAACRPVGPVNFSIGMITLSYLCQAKCPHCGVPAGPKRDKNELRKEEIFSLLDQFAALGVKWADFFGGEPLLDKNLPEYIRYAKGVGLVAVTDTNGLLLDEKMVLALKRAGTDQIYVSIDSADPEVHDRWRGVPGMFNKAMDGVRLCVKHGLKCVLSPYASKKNIRNGDLRKLVDLGLELGTQVRISFPIYSGGVRRDEKALFTDEDFAILKSMLVKGKVYMEIEGIDTPETTFVCDAGKALFFLNPTGDVMPCCFCEARFGNVREEPLGRILSRMTRSRLVDGIEEGDCPMNRSEFRRRNDRALSVPGAFAEIASDAAGWDAKAEDYRDFVDPILEPYDRLIGAPERWAGLSVLDAGCGTGRFAAAAAAAGARVTLLDASEAMLDKARERLAGCGGAAFVKGDASRRDLTLGGGFDLVVAAGLLKALPEAGGAVDNLKRWVKPGGRLVILDPAGGASADDYLEFHERSASLLGPERWTRLFREGSSAALLREVFAGSLPTPEAFLQEFGATLPGLEARRTGGLFLRAEWRNP